MTETMEIATTPAYPKTKSGVKPLPIHRYQISAADLIRYLEGNLGFKVNADIKILRGMINQHGGVATNYAIMRLVMRPEDIIMNEQFGGDGSSYASRILNATNSGSQRFKASVIEELKPFVYSRNELLTFRQNPELPIAKLMAGMGLFGEELDKLIRHSEFLYNEQIRKFQICLRPERIIADYLTNPDMGKINGTLDILGVGGSSPETVYFDVQISEIDEFEASRIGMSKLFTFME
jgi:hypothetical protein